jgi:hypothetical protein
MADFAFLRSGCTATPMKNSAAEARFLSNFRDPQQYPEKPLKNLILAANFRKIGP